MTKRLAVLNGELSEKVLDLRQALTRAEVATKAKDLKYLNAYSSVSHCGLVFVGLAAMTAVGLRGAVLQMLAHGFITAAIFFIIFQLIQLFEQ